MFFFFVSLPLSLSSFSSSSTIGKVKAKTRLTAVVTQARERIGRQSVIARSGRD